MLAYRRKIWATAAVGVVFGTAALAIGQISPWVADLRASFRYVAGGLIILGAVSTLYLPADLLVQDAVWNLAGSVFAFLFGDRMYFKFVKR